MSEENNNEFELKGSGIPELACGIYLQLPNEIKKPKFISKGEEVEPKTWGDVVLEYRGVKHFFTFQEFIDKLGLERGE